MELQKEPAIESLVVPGIELLVVEDASLPPPHHDPERGLSYRSRNMKKTSLVALALCAGAPLMAQTPTVTFYGVLDAGVAHVQHSLDFSDQFPVGSNPFPQKSTKGATGMFDGGLSQNRVGFRVSTDLTNDWKAFLQGETAFNLTTGVVVSTAQR